MADLHVGFTGTRELVTEPQEQILRVRMNVLNLQGLRCVGHSGDCVNADALFHGIAVEKGWRTVGHIPLKDALRAYCKYDEEREPANYHERNRQIVHASNCMIALPNTMHEKPNGGTWFTIRYSRESRKPLLIIWPDGTWTREGGPVNVGKTRHG